MSDVHSELNCNSERTLKLTLHEALQRELRQRQLDVVDVVPIPPLSGEEDRTIRLRTIEEILYEYDKAEQKELLGYIVQLRPAFLKKSNTTEKCVIEQKTTEATAPFLSPPVKPTLDGIYLPNGKLNVMYLLNNAEILVHAKDFELAKKIFRSVVQSGEMVWRGLLGLGRCYEFEQKFDLAQGTYEESIAYHPSYDAYSFLAKLLLRQKKDVHAAEVLSRALHLKQLSSDQKYELLKDAALCWCRAGQCEKAEPLFYRALEVRPNSQEIREHLGNVYLQVHRLDEALKLFQECLALNVDHPRAHYGIGRCHLEMGNKRQAHDSFAKSLDRDLNHPAAIFYLVKCAYEIKSYATAARIVEEYIEVAPINANLLYSLAGLQFHLGRLQDAAVTAQRVLGIAPQHVGAKDLLGMIHPLASENS